MGFEDVVFHIECGDLLDILAGLRLSNRLADDRAVRPSPHDDAG
jgi:hypothetical protein